jgi:hypothetical protein
LELPDVFNSHEAATMIRGTTAGLFATLLLTTAAAGDGPKWLTDYGPAREVARAAGKPILLVFRCER